MLTSKCLSARKVPRQPEAPARPRLCGCRFADHKPTTIYASVSEGAVRYLTLSSQLGKREEKDLQSIRHERQQTQSKATLPDRECLEGSSPPSHQ